MALNPPVDIWNFFSPGQLVFGWGSSARLGELVARRSWHRLLVVSDRQLLSAGVVDQATSSLKELGIDFTLFDGGEAEPSLECAERSIAFAADVRPDAILGLGGGSNMDLAKMTAIGATYGSDLRRFFGEDTVPGPVLPIICLPTTAGTGSEVSGSGVLTDSVAGVKVGVTSNYLRPSISIVDPALTVSCPRKVTAHSGIDALTHAIEACTAVDNSAFPLPAGVKTIYQGRHPLGMLLAEKAIRLIGENLVTACDAPGDVNARTSMSLAALLAGMAFSNIGVALVHAMEYPLGVATHCSHGEGNGLLLPHVMRFNQPVRKMEFAEIASWLGSAVNPSDADAAASEAVTAVVKLQQQIGIRVQLRDLGLPHDRLPEMARKAFGISRLLRVNARYPTEAEILTIFEQAF